MAALLAHYSDYTVYMNLACTDPRRPEEKANCISWNATLYKQCSDQRPRIRPLSVSLCV